MIKVWLSALAISRFRLQAWLIRFVDFANEGVQINLAVSLHALNDLRTSIMRINRSFLSKACSYRIILRRDQPPVTFEYIMLNEVNDGVEK